MSHSSAPSLRSPHSPTGWLIFTDHGGFEFPDARYVVMNDDQVRVELYDSSDLLVGIVVYEHFIGFIRNIPTPPPTTKASSHAPGFPN
jgi:hypothetical protein